MVWLVKFTLGRSWNIRVSILISQSSSVINGGAEIASTGKCKYGKVKYKVAKCVRVENASTENSSRSDQGWKMHVRKIQVGVSRVGKCKYGKIEYGITVQSRFSLITN